MKQTQKEQFIEKLVNAQLDEDQIDYIMSSVNEHFYPRDIPLSELINEEIDRSIRQNLRFNNPDSGDTLRWNGSEVLAG